MIVVWQVTDKSNTTLNLLEILRDEFQGADVKVQGKLPSRDISLEKCMMPCEMTAKLMKEEKHSLCRNLQHSLVSYTRSTRKLIRDMMDEHQRSLEFLSNQVRELMNKVQSLSVEALRSNAEMFTLKPVPSHGRDCSDIKETMDAVAKIPSGIYIIQPEDTDYAFEVFCEMDYMGGGWTVIQRRTDGLTDFKRAWTDYTDGFGHLPGEHWLGLRKVFSIVNQKNTHFQLHIALVSQDDTNSYASYDDFRIDDETKFFAIHLGRYAGSAGDAFRGYSQEQNQDTAPFSTSDIDNDGCSPLCTFEGQAVESCSVQQNNTGWWFNQCGLSNLNGSPLDSDLCTQPHIRWDTWTQNGVAVKIKAVTMKIKRVYSPVPS
ncbi:angiopoietin-related protein 5 [Megalops cyprinoides]|uniref:angiopoietin-related protein 5 n=1 Tax=Megalops cyprinoides TaxID=118141 RepID=UPI001864F03E|nr:angiopoietin-related protein 5 [Megalops cyprinoides]